MKCDCKINEDMIRGIINSYNKERYISEDDKAEFIVSIFYPIEYPRERMIIEMKIKIKRKAIVLNEYYYSDYTTVEEALDLTILRLLKCTITNGIDYALEYLENKD